MTYHFLLFLLVIPISGFYIKDPSWQIWKNTYQKTYVNEDEEKLRYAVWENNMKKITDFNQLNKGFELAMNQYGDLTHDEFTFRMKGYLGKSVYNNTSLGSSFLKPLGVSYPKEVDWREHGYVTPVKDQSSPHRCGSCWAFSATGSLEGQHFRKTGKLVSLSEQNLIDCSRKYGNHGCHGGLMDRAFRYIKDNGGIDTEENYPYKAVVSVDRGTVAGCSCLNEDGLPCRFKKQTIGATITGYTDIERGNEEELKAAVATVGPVSVAIDASDFFFKFYKNGVYDNEMCSSYHLNHGVLAVGYGTNSNGKDYWIIKNSWGEHWGNKGYILMSRNKHNQCGIATQASYPLV